MRFVKMEGLGNDFIVVEEQEIVPFSSALPLLATKLCDRHFGVGADGVIVVCSSQLADIGMRIFNADGSEAEMCGNGIRCLAKFVFERRMVEKTEFAVETKAGLIFPQVVAENGRVAKVVVNMGKPRLSPQEIPVHIQGDTVVGETLPVEERVFHFTAVSMGNPHVVIFEVPSNWEDWGRKIEIHPLFPRRTNVEFVEVVSPQEARVKVWERGAGPTLACGTGACAVLVAGVLNGLLEKEARIHLPGGSLRISWKEDGNVYMEGEAREVFEGKVSEGVIKEWMSRSE